MRILSPAHTPDCAMPVWWQRVDGRERVLEPPLAAVSAAYTPRQVPAGMCDLASGNLDAALLPALALGAAEDSRNKTAMTSAAISRY